MQQSELSTMPAGELADVLDLVIWNMGGKESPPVAEWLTELRARSDADTPAVRQAVAVCMNICRLLARLGNRSRHHALSEPHRARCGASHAFHDLFSHARTPPKARSAS
jgi:hypothetical protein